jgi:hypothetical protein
MIARDTAPSARRVQLEALRRLDGVERLLMACRMSDESRAVTLAGIRHRHPEWTESAVHRELLRLMLGAPLARSVIDSRRVHQ